MSSNQVLNCYRCEKTATVFIPESNRALCEVHLETFKEAYASFHFSSVEISEDNIAAIIELTPKQATSVDELSTVVQKDDHRVPIKLITDHLGELATGVEPATCKVCGKFMQLHAQFSTTKQVDLGSFKAESRDQSKSAGLTNQELQEATRPDFLDRFADAGRGHCLTCNGSGLQVIDKPSDIKTIYKHLNDDNSGSGHYHQLVDMTDRLKGIDLNTAITGNLPFYITKYKNFEVNPQFQPDQISEFPFSLGTYKQFEFGKNPHQLLHTLFHALGEFDPVLDSNHGHAKVNSLENLYGLDKVSEEDALQQMQNPFCPTCYGHGQHPLRNHEDFEDYLGEISKRDDQIPRDQARRRKPNTKFDPMVDAGVVDLSQLKTETTNSVTAHAGPNIKPHDHHNKPHTYQKRQQQPGQPSSNPSSGSGQIKQPRKKGPSSGGGKSKGLPGVRKRNIFDRFPVEKWIYEAMNAVHDMTHTVYENPSYMYRNPNPMYYSVPRKQWGMAKPWRN